MKPRLISRNTPICIKLVRYPFECAKLAQKCCHSVFTYTNTEIVVLSVQNIRPRAKDNSCTALMIQRRQR